MPYTLPNWPSSETDTRLLKGKAARKMRWWPTFHNSGPGPKISGISTLHLLLTRLPHVNIYQACSKYLIMQLLILAKILIDLHVFMLSLPAIFLIFLFLVHYLLTPLTDLCIHLNLCVMQNVSFILWKQQIKLNKIYTNIYFLCINTCKHACTHTYKSSRALTKSSQVNGCTSIKG